MQLFIQPRWSSQGTHAAAYWRKTLCMQSVQLLLQGFQRTEVSQTFAHRRETLCLQKMRLLMQAVGSIEEAHEKASFRGYRINILEKCHKKIT